MPVALPLAWSASLAFSLHSGLPSAQAFTRIMKHLHLCVIYLYCIPILSSLLTLLGSVLVLDQPEVHGRTSWRRNHLDVDCTIYFGDTIHSAVFLGGGFLVDR